MPTYLMQGTEDDLRRIIVQSVTEALANTPLQDSSSQPEDSFLTQAEAAAILRTTKQTVIAWTKQGRLKVKRFGRKVLYSKQEVLSIGGKE